MMLVYGLLLTSALAVSAPWWGWRMLTSGRYRAGLAGRLGRIPPALAQACAGKRVIWLHAVSVGEVLAITRLIQELGQELRQTFGDDWLIALSTTTATGQQIARERLDPATVFWFPLAFAVRPYLRTLRPELLILVEGELWPRVLSECARARIPVAVVNARVSDRSFRRTMRLRRLWLLMASKVTLWLAQGLETTHRLQQLGIVPSKIKTPGNLKYDTPATSTSEIAAWVSALAAGRPILVAGSTLADKNSSAPDEEQMILHAWSQVQQTGTQTLLILAPRHPERFDEAFATASEYRVIRASSRHQPAVHPHADQAHQQSSPISASLPPEIILLDTLGDLATVYSVATAAFIGGSLVPRGGHNPLEAARFGVPILMGPSYENFREIVEGMRAADAILISDAQHLAASLTHLLQEGKPMGQRAQAYFEAQAGATARTVQALLELLSA